MARIQRHHINYEPGWIVELTMQMHRCISRIQITKATHEQYARITNFMHALAHEWCRMRQELDINDGIDLRAKKPKGPVTYRRRRFRRQR